MCRHGPRTLPLSRAMRHLRVQYPNKITGAGGFPCYNGRRLLGVSRLARGTPLVREPSPRCPVHFRHRITVYLITKVLTAAK